MSGLTHFDAKGDAHMVDVSDKPVTARVATAAAWVKMLPQTLDLITEGRAKKGDVASVARLAGIMAAKKTHDLIPLCHPLMLTKIAVDIEADAALPGLRVVATASLSGRTGVEMEALTAVQIALLTVYDMCKAVDRGMTVTGVHVVEKRGGKSGSWTAPAA